MKKFKKYEALHENITKEISEYDKISERISKTMKKMGVEPLPPTYEGSIGFEDLDKAMNRIRKHFWFNIPEIREYHKRMKHKVPTEVTLLEKERSEESNVRGEMPTLKEGTLGYISMKEFEKMKNYEKLCSRDVTMAYNLCENDAIKIMRDCTGFWPELNEESLQDGGIHEKMDIIDKMYKNIIDKRKDNQWAWKRDPQKSSGNPFIVCLRY